MPAAAYVPFVRSGNLVFLSGHIAKKDGKPWVVVKITGGSPPFTYMLNGEPVHGRVARREAGIGPEGLGFAQISVIDATGATDQVTVRLQ